MPVIYSKHALKRLSQRGIPKSFISMSIQYPDKIYPADDFQRIKVLKNFGNQDLIVIYSKHKSIYTVITTYWRNNEN